ncbi:MAG: BACON domain-containing protein [Acidobacteria bacterium]|nr:BACON domain-containing protein [Acidobacteriota bacterium]
MRSYGLLAFPAGGGSGSFSASSGCAWTITKPDWVTINSPSNGPGQNIQVGFTVAANPGAARVGSITFVSVTNPTEEIPWIIAQNGVDAPYCTLYASPPHATYSMGGHPGTLNVLSPAGCAWSAAADVPWIWLTSLPAGSGNGSFNYAVQAGGTSPRIGRITLYGSDEMDIFTINQDGSIPCPVTLNPNSRNVSFAAGTGTVNVSAPAGCPWTAQVHDIWVNVDSGASGTGNGTVSYSYMQYVGQTPRTATLSIGGQAFTLTQEGSCTSPSLNPTSREVSAAAGSGTINVTTAAGCPWTAGSNANWITIISGASGTGSGAVGYSFQANPSTTARSGTITIGGQTFTLNQEGPCTSLSLNPPIWDVPSTAGNGTINVTATAGCAWTAASNSNWITVVSGASGTGSAAVGYSFQQNPNTTARNGTITIGGKTFTLNQPGTPPCTSVSLNPASQNVSSAPGVGTISVTPTAGCGVWTAVSNANWITIVSGASGTGSADVVYSFQENPTTNPRTGTITIGGQTFTLNQTGPCCSVSLNPASQNVSSAAGSGTINVTAGSAWTAVSNANWITVVSGASGTGNGAVGFNYQQNPNATSRSGTLTIGGQTFTLTQEGAPCTITINPTSQSVSSAAGSGTTNVTAAAGCTWTAASNANWITVASGASGTGSGTVSYSYQQNPNTTNRSGTLTIGGQTFTLSQAAPGTPLCSYDLSSQSASLPASGGTINVILTTGPACAWTVTLSDAWLNVTSPLNGTGPATITLTVLANPGAQSRNGTVSVGGKTFAVSQQAGPTPPSAGLRLVTLEPCRVMETRAEYNYQGRTGSFGPPYMRANETRTLNLPASSVCPIPAGAKAYLLNVTVIPRNGTGVDYLTVYPTGEGRPLFWTVRSPDGLIVANSAIVRAGTNGGIEVFAASDADMIIDISGYYTDNRNVSSLVYYPLTPCRVIDTRAEYRTPAGPFGPPTMDARQTRRFRFPASPYCQIPAGAAAYSITITAVPPGPLAFITAWPAGGAQPNVSSINSPAGRVLANSVVLPASPDGSIDVFTYDRTDFLVDINGYYAPDDGVNGLLYFPVSQCRAADTTSSVLPAPFGGAICESQLSRSLPIPGSPACSSIPANAKAFAVNITALPNGSPMPFLTAYPTGQARPNASMLNAFQGQIVTNSAIIPAGPNGSIDVYPYSRTHVVVEISGYFGR